MKEQVRTLMTSGPPALVYWIALMACGYCLEVVCIVLKRKGREMAGNKKRESIQEPSAPNHRVAFVSRCPSASGNELFNKNKTKDGFYVARGVVLGPRMIGLVLTLDHHVETDGDRGRVGR